MLNYEGHINYITLVCILEPEISRWQDHIRVTISLKDGLSITTHGLHGARGRGRKGGEGYSLTFSVGHGRRRPSKTCRGIGTLGRLTQNITILKGSLKLSIPFSRSYLEPNCHKQLHADPAWLWNCELVEALRLSVRYGFHPNFDTVLGFPTSRYYRSEYTKFDRRIFSSHLLVQKV